MRRVALASAFAAAGAGCTLIAGIDGMHVTDCAGACDGGPAGDGGTSTEAGGSDAGDAARSDAPPPAEAGSDGGARSLLRIRCGSPGSAAPYTDSRGLVWSNDADFDVGSVVSNNDTIAGTSDPALYHTERFADRLQYPSGFTYTFNGLPSGAYVVVLHFVEASSANIRGPNERKFDVFLDGTEVLTEYDIYADVGFDHASVKTFTTSTQGSPLVVRFAPGSIQNPKVDAIEVLAQ